MKDLDTLIAECVEHDWNVRNERSVARYTSEIRESIESVYRHAEHEQEGGREINVPIPVDVMKAILGSTKRPTLILPDTTISKDQSGGGIPEEYVEKCRELIRSTYGAIRHPPL